MLQGNRLRSGLLRTALVAGTALAAAPAAHAFNPPSPMKIDGGPLGQLLLSGGADGYAYGLTGAGSSSSPGLLGTDKSGGAEFMNGLVELQKSDGIIQGTIEAGSTNNFVMGYAPHATSVTTFATGPLYAAYLTLVPNSYVSISAGHLGSLEGYESGIDWNNFNVLTTDIFAVENSQSTGVQVTGTAGPLSATLLFGDGFDTQQWSYMQASATYTANANNAATLFGATNIATIGLGAHYYGSAITAYNATTVGSAGAANFVNSSMIGGYYSWTLGNLNVVPEFQYTWATKTPSVGLAKFSSNLGLAVFANYQFGSSPWSLGGWVQYFSSNGPDAWFLNAGSQGVGFSIAPTWQGKYLFVRGDIGYMYLSKVGVPGSAAYGSSGNQRSQATFLVETGVLF